MILGDLFWLVQHMQIVKENQILHKGQRIIEPEYATLADMNIFPGDKLWVQDSEIHEHRDIAGNKCFYAYINHQELCLGLICF